ncbi:ATP-binding protein [Streptomyces sp. NPDC048527]|uniref:ATP-binding protein n=1 Tax=Streptomyces sp. NPDC048527 TaxID=3365568 RepID=UPI003716FEFA
MEPAAVTLPLLREMPLCLPAEDTAMRRARITGRTWLTMLNWPGSVHAATEVLQHLVDNAVRYGLKDAKSSQTLDVCFRVTESRELLIDVADPNPAFPDFDQATRGELGRGLWNARQAGAMLTWFVNRDFDGKTVRATMRPGRAEL